MLIKTIPQSDILGAMASGLCVLHCIATPFLFLAQSCSVSGCCESGPTWWSSIDYLFIGITFFAVYQSSKNTNQLWLKYAMYSTWMLLSLFVLNEKVTLLPLSEWWKYSSAFGLIALHLYSLKFCQCADEACGVT
ncbi:MAG: MerC domain-containing protein [Bacteroidota bacterium]